MLLRRVSLWLGVLCLGCHVLPAALQWSDDDLAAGQLWEQGQEAMRRGLPDEAIHCYEQSLGADPEMVVNHLSLAVAYLEKKDQKEACVHLAIYVDARPDEPGIRARYAELLSRLHRISDARSEFERSIARAQEQGAPAANQLLHCHGRLVQIAEEAEDAYAEHLHRGIGLYQLARKRVTLPDPDGVLPTEGLLCKAAAELTLAQMERPNEARPCWYLYAIWSQLGQRQPALCQLRRAEAAAPFTYLTPVEQRSLESAYQNYRAQLHRL
jgi:tetratricopeptide (TPR) repeat protein